MLVFRGLVNYLVLLMRMVIMLLKEIHKEDIFFQGMDFAYFEKKYKLIAADLSKQKV